MNAYFDEMKKGAGHTKDRQAAMALLCVDKRQDIESAIRKNPGHKRGETDDVVGTVYTKAQVRSKNEPLVFQTESQFIAYLKKVINSVVMDARRQECGRKPSKTPERESEATDMLPKRARQIDNTEEITKQLESTPSREPDPHNAAADKEWLDESLKMLACADRILIVWYLRDKMSFDEMGQQLMIDATKVEERIEKALTKLTKRFVDDRATL